MYSVYLIDILQWIFRQDALREIMQEITLSGLNRAGFFEKAAFYDLQFIV